MPRLRGAVPRQCPDSSAAPPVCPAGRLGSHPKDRHKVWTGAAEAVHRESDGRRRVSAGRLSAAAICGAQGPRQPSPARYLTTGEASAPPRQHRFRQQDVGRGAPRTSNPTRSRAARHGARPWIRRPLEVLSYRGRATRAGKFSPPTPTPTPTPTCRLIAAGFATARFPGQACRVQRRAGALACRDEQPRRALYGRLPRSQPGSAPSAGGAKGLCRAPTPKSRPIPPRGLLTS